MSEDEDRERELRRSLAEAIEAKDALTALTASKGWTILCQIAEEQIKRRVNQVTLLPLGEYFTSVYVQEFVKGEITGIRTFVALPSITIEEHTRTIHGTASDSGSGSGE
jgi:hypothetical protein